jgi:site-specific DNA-methyltransferase (adenine-specific)
MTRRKSDPPSKAPARPRKPPPTAATRTALAKADPERRWKGNPVLEPFLRPLAELLADPANARRHPETNIAGIMASFARYGQQVPIVSDAAGVIRKGNGSLVALQRLGWTHIAVIPSDLAGSDLAGFGIADNATGLSSEWDDAVLAAQLASLQDEGFPMEATGFGAEELAAILAGVDSTDAGDGSAGTEEDGGGQIDRAAELQAHWGTERGQLWTIPSKATPGREHRLLIGDNSDAGDVQRLLAGGIIDAVISDPPYGIAYDTDTRRFRGGKKYRPIANDDRAFDPSPYLDYPAVVLWGANCYSQRLPMGTWLVWDKRFASGTSGGLLSDAEVAWMKTGHGVYIHAITSQGFVRPEPVQHPTQKPVALMAWCFEKCKAGPTIFDPYAGSGTTLVASEQTGRVCYGLEIDPGYAAVILQRLKDLGLAPTLES